MIIKNILKLKNFKKKKLLLQKINNKLNSLQKLWKKMI